MSYKKLVRDKIPEIIEASGGKPITKTLADDEYLRELIKKLKEETEELAEDNSVEELADVQEVILALCEYLGISKEELERAREQKAKQRGAFKKRIYLEGVEGEEL